MGLNLEQISYFNLISYEYFILCIFLALVSGLVIKYIIGVKIISVVSFSLMALFIAFLYPESTLFSILFGFFILLLVYIVIRYSIIFLRNYVYHYAALLTLAIAFGQFIFILLTKGYDLLSINFTFIPRLQVFILFCSLLLVPLIDSWLSYQLRSGFKKSFRGFINTLLCAVLLGSFFSYSRFAEFVSQFYLFIIFTIIVSVVLIGRYSGFRFTEFIRFWPVIYNKNSKND